MALTLFETPDQKIQRERKKFGISVEQEVQRFTRAKGALAVQQLQDKEDEEKERRQALDFQRQKFRELIAPTMDAEIQRVNDERDRIDGERTKFRDLIGPTIDRTLADVKAAQDKSEGIALERGRFRELVQPSLDALRQGTPTATATPTATSTLRAGPPDLLGPSVAPTPTPTATRYLPLGLSIGTPQLSLATTLCSATTLNP